ncbi:unnamed protein product [Staurois parvus]|uniref:Uncharacterized protein n=1 Tax=Staurois parvus TaxID=386267 RepID=A0ABN9F1H1_9NEOB|nr:unnamed protein product [Staurois parvus]
MYINGQTGAVQEWVAVYKRPPRCLLVRTLWECAAPRSGAHCVLQTQWNTDRCIGPPYEAPIT